MAFEDIAKKYPGRGPAFPAGLPKPNEADLKKIIFEYNLKFPQSFIDFQLEYCHTTPIGDFAFEGFGWANKDLEPYLKLENVAVDYKELKLPDYLTPFKQENGDFWCFDNRSGNEDYPVVIFDHNLNGIEKDPEFNWANFIDWLDKTMETEY